MASAVARRRAVALKRSFPVLMLLLYLALRRSYRMVGPKGMVLLTTRLAPTGLALTGLMLSWFAPAGLSSAGLASAGAAEWAKLESALQSITVAHLHTDAAVLADDTFEGRAAGSRGGRAAARYLVQRLRAAGLKPGTAEGYAQPFHGNERNLLATLAGSDQGRKHELIIVGAHYDHVGYGNRQNSNGPIGTIHNGADDNASGVATLLEVIDAMAHRGYRPQRSILFAFWDGEEDGLLGSRYWTQHPTVPLSSVRLMVNADMVGRMRAGRLEIVGTRLGYGMRKLLSSPRLATGMWLDFTWELKENSDHWSFLERGIPAICLHTGLHNDYHRPSDDIEKLNVVGMQQVARYLLDLLTEVGGDITLPSYRGRGRYESPASQRRTQQPLAPYVPRLGISWRYVEAGGKPYCLVTNVQPASAAAKADLRVGDQIFSIDGQPLTGEGLLPAVLLRADSAVRLAVVRLPITSAPPDSAEPRGAVHALEETEGGTGVVGAGVGRTEDSQSQDLSQGQSRGEGTPAGQPETVTVKLAGQPTQLGLSWREDEGEPQSVYVTRVVPYSPAARAGIQLRDRIDALESEPVAGQDDLFTRLHETLAARPESFRLTIETRGRLHDVEINMELPTGQAGDRSF